MKDPNTIYNLHFLSSLDANGKLRVIRLMHKLSQGYTYSWSVLVDFFRFICCIAGHNYPNSLDLLNTLPTEPRLQFIKLLRQIKRAKTFREVHYPIRGMNIILDQEDWDLINLIMR